MKRRCTVRTVFAEMSGVGGWTSTDVESNALTGVQARRTAQD